VHGVNKKTGGEFSTRFFGAISTQLDIMVLVTTFENMADCASPTQIFGPSFHRSHVDAL
jgi:hypothetical protein